MKIVELKDGEPTGNTIESNHGMQLLVNMKDEPGYEYRIETVDGPVYDKYGKYPGLIPAFPPVPAPKPEDTNEVATPSVQDS